MLKVYSEFVGNLDDAHYNFVRVAIFVEEAETNHGVVFARVGLYVNNLVVLQMFFNLLLKYI